MLFDSLHIVISRLMDLLLNVKSDTLPCGKLWLDATLKATKSLATGVAPLLAGLLSCLSMPGFDYSQSEIDRL